MRIIFSIFAVAVVLFGVNNVKAQAGRNGAKTDGKSNARQAEPPKPTPTPVIPAAAGNKAAVDDGEVIKVNTQLVSIPVRVMDKKGRFFGGLGKGNFKILED